MNDTHQSCHTYEWHIGELVWRSQKTFRTTVGQIWLFCARTSLCLSLSYSFSGSLFSPLSLFLSPSPPLSLSLSVSLSPTHTHTTHTCTHIYMYGITRGYSDVSPGVGMRHLEGSKNPDGLNLGIHIFVHVYKVHMCMYMLRGGMTSWTNCLFL